MNKPTPYKTHHFVAGDPTMVRPPANKRKPPPRGAHHGRGPALIGALTPARVLFAPYVAEFSEKVLTTPHSCAILMETSGERMICILSQTPCRESMQLRSSPTASLRRARLNSPDHESGLFFCSLAARRSPGDRGRGGCDRVPAGRRQAADRRTLPMGRPQQFPLLDI